MLFVSVFSISNPQQHHHSSHNTSAVKFLVWRRRQRTNEATGQRQKEDEEVVLEVETFLVGLGDRLQSLVRRGLFPYDISPLLERLRELRAAMLD